MPNFRKGMKIYFPEDFACMGNLIGGVPSLTGADAGKCKNQVREGPFCQENAENRQGKAWGPMWALCQVVCPNEGSGAPPSHGGIGWVTLVGLGLEGSSWIGKSCGWASLGWRRSG